MLTDGKQIKSESIKLSKISRVSSQGNFLFATGTMIGVTDSPTLGTDLVNLNYINSLSSANGIFDTNNNNGVLPQITIDNSGSGFLKFEKSTDDYVTITGDSILINATNNNNTISSSSTFNSLTIGGGSDNYVIGSSILSTGITGVISIGDSNISGSDSIVIGKGTTTTSSSGIINLNSTTISNNIPDTFIFSINGSYDFGLRTGAVEIPTHTIATLPTFINSRNDLSGFAIVSDYNGDTTTLAYSDNTKWIYLPSLLDDNTLGGTNPSDTDGTTQKAVKEYIDAKDSYEFRHYFEGDLNGLVSDSTDTWRELSLDRLGGNAGGVIWGCTDLGGDGNIYMTDNGVNTIFKFNPNSNKIEAFYDRTIGGSMVCVDSSFYHPLTHSIYYPGRDGNIIIKFDLEYKTFTSITVSGVTVGSLMAYGVGFDSNGENAYFIPLETNGNTIIKFNIINETFSEFTTGEDCRVVGAKTSRNGKIYCAPYEAEGGSSAKRRILVVDTTNDSTYTIDIANVNVTGAPVNGAAMSSTGSTLSVDRRYIYFGCRYKVGTAVSAGIMKVDSSDDSVTYTEMVGNPGSHPSSIFGKLVTAPNGKIYNLPSVGNTALVYDTETDTLEEIVGNTDTLFSLVRKSNPTLAPNGNIYSGGDTSTTNISTSLKITINERKFDVQDLIYLGCDTI